MTETFREPSANNRNRLETLITTTTASINWSDGQRPTKRRPREIRLTKSSDNSTRATQLFRSSQPQASSSDRAQMQTQRHHKHLLASNMPTKELIRPIKSRQMLWLALALSCLCSQLLVGGASDISDQKQTDPRSTQPTLDRQLESPSSSSSSSSSVAAANGSVKPAQPAAAPAEGPKQPHQHEQAMSSSAKQQHKASPNAASQKKAAALAAQRDYDKYQLKASSSTSPARVAAAAADSAAAAAAVVAADAQKQASDKANKRANNSDKQEAAPGSATAAGHLEPAHKKVGQLPNTRPQPKASAFSILKRFLPSFMTSAAAAAAAVSASAVADKQPNQNQHSRSSSSSLVGSSAGLLSSLLSASHSTGQSTSAGSPLASRSVSGSSSSSGGGVGESSGLNSPLTGKIINLLTGAQKKKGLPDGLTQAIPNHAPFFMRKAAADRQAAGGGGGALALASGLLSNPLKLGLLFSAPLLPSLLLTPLALAGLSPAMSAINNFFGDDDEPSPAAGPSQSPLASILQATGNLPFASSDSGSSSSSSSSSSSASSGTSNNFALQALQSFVLGPTSTTERPLFKPGVFASSGIQNAAGAIGSALQSAGSSSASTSSSSPSSSSNANNQRPFFGSGGGLMQAAASMISPSFAAPPSSSASSSQSSNNDEDGPGLIQMASDVFEKVANYMGNDNTKDGQAIAQASAPSSSVNSPLSTLASLTNFTPFQFSSLFASSPLGTAMAGSSGQSSVGSSSSSPSSVGNKNQRVGFFSTLRNVYELFSSSFLRRQEIGNENECQQRLLCEFHQRAMNSKRFKRTLQASLGELVNLDRNLIEQLKYNSQAIQARVDPDTKLMLNDFLKAANNFKSGRDMINCPQLFPKCTRTQLLATANAHLKDANNEQAIGKFGQLMKKMKFISNQQSASQWKLLKPGKSQQQHQLSQGARTTMSANQPIDHMQVVPLQSPSINVAGQLTPVDSLKLAQQIMMIAQMSQQQQQQQQQPQPTSPPALSQYTSSVMVPQMSQQWVSQSTGGQGISSAPVYVQSQSPQIVANSQVVPAQQPNYSYNQHQQQQQHYPTASKQQTTYTDAMLPVAASAVYNPTESPYFVQQPNSQPQQQQQQQFVGIGNMYGEPDQSQTGHAMMSANQHQNTNNNSQQQQSQQNSFPTPVQDQSMPQQQQPGLGLNMDNKNKPQQLLSSNKMAAIAA